MKANELMIGDWVTLNGVDYKWQWTHHDFTASEFRTLEPIPLTPEILEKNGLSHKRIDKKYDGWEIDIEPFSAWWILDITHSVDGGYDYSLENYPICCVHELQRALRCCGLNELADNFKI